MDHNIIDRYQTGKHHAMNTQKALENGYIVNPQEDIYKNVTGW